MANMAARSLARMPAPIVYNTYGGFATMGGSAADRSKAAKENMYQGPAWFTDNMKDVY